MVSNKLGKLFVALSFFVLLTFGTTACAQQSDQGQTAALAAGVQSIVNNDMSGLKRALDQGADINGNLDERAGRSLLTTAAWEQRVPMVKLLLSKHADVNIQDGDGRTPLMLAARQGNLDIVKELVTHGADPSAASANGTGALDLAKKSGNQAVVGYLSNVKH